MVKPVKLVVGVAVGCGLLALYLSNSPVTEEPAPTAVVEAVVPLTDFRTLSDETAPKAAQSPRVVRPKMSANAKESRARHADKVEKRPVNWGDRGMPPTDSVTTTVLSSNPR